KGPFQRQNWPGAAPQSAPYPKWLEKVIDRRSEKAKSPKQITVQSQSPTKTVVSDIPKTSPLSKLPKSLDKFSKLGRRIPLLGGILGGASILAAPEGTKAKTAGGVGGMLAGGAAGAAGGAALGSVVPVIGTGIGGI